MKNVFANRNYRLVFFGALVSNVGALLYSFAVSFYILEITNNNAFLQGLYLALCGAVNLIFTPVGGILGDRFHKGKIMFVCDYLKGAAILLATAAMLLQPRPLRPGHRRRGPNRGWLHQQRQPVAGGGCGRL